MKLLFLLIPFLVSGQSFKKSRDKITLKMDFEVIDTLRFLKDIIYVCRDKTRIRITKDSIYIYNKHQYLKHGRSKKDN